MKEPERERERESARERVEFLFCSEMKRSRDEVYMGSQLKRPVVSSRGEA